MTHAMPETRREADEQRRPTDIETVIEEMRRFLDHTFAGFTRWPTVRYSDTWVPAVDVEETEEAYIVEAELPGVRKEDVSVELIGSELTITGEAKAKERTGVVRRRTRRSGQFAYWITLPETVDPGGIDAELKDGVLRVTVPKSERAQRRTIPLKA
jgi:HSP20 family protein